LEDVTFEESFLIFTSQTSRTLAPSLVSAWWQHLHRSLLDASRNCQTNR